MADSGPRPEQDQESGFVRTLVQDFRRVLAEDCAAWVSSGR